MIALYMSVFILVVYVCVLATRILDLEDKIRDLSAENCKLRQPQEVPVQEVDNRVDYDESINRLIHVIDREDEILKGVTKP